jgi:hypothetical protein
MPEDGWLEERRDFMRDLEEESVTLRQRADEAERELHELGESLQGDTVESLSDAGEGGAKDPRLLRYVVGKCRRASAEADNLTEELRGLITLHEEFVEGDDDEEDED